MDCFLKIYRFYYFLNYYFWLHQLFVAGPRLSLVAESGGYSTVVGCGLLMAVDSFLAELGLWVRGLCRCSSWAQG